MALVKVKRWHVTGDTWHVICGLWHLTYDTRHMTFFSFFLSFLLQKLFVSFCKIFVNFCPFWYLCYYLHTSRNSVSPVCRIFTKIVKASNVCSWDSNKYTLFGRNSWLKVGYTYTVATHLQLAWCNYSCHSMQSLSHLHISIFIRKVLGLYSYPYDTPWKVSSVLSRSQVQCLD